MRISDCSSDVCSSDLPGLTRDRRAPTFLAIRRSRFHPSAFLSMAIGTAPAANPVFLGGLARRLVADKLISDAQAREAQQRAIKDGMPFVSALIAAKTLSSRKIAEVASMEFGAPLIDITAIEIDPAVAGEVSDKVLRKVHALPLFKRGKKTFVAVSDPTNLQALDEIKFATGNMTEAVLVEEDKLVKAIEAAIQAGESQRMDLGDSDLENLEVAGGEAEERKSVGYGKSVAVSVEFG